MSDRNVRLVITAQSELPEVATQLERLIQLEGKLLEAVNQANLSARTGSIQQIEAINSVSAALEKQRTTRKRSDEEAAEGAKAIQQQINNITGGLKTFTGVVASAFAISEIKSFGESIIEAKTKIDSVQISLETMLGSKKEADELYARIVELSQKTPFSLSEVADQAVKLKAYNIETADLIPTITALGNVAAAVGKEKLPQLTLAYGQIKNAGVLMGTELRQLNETGLPILDLIQKSYNKTSAEVKKMSDDHQISFAMVRKAIMDASAEGGKYEGLMEKLSKTVGGQVSNLADAFEVAKGRIGDFFENQISGGTARLKGLIEALAGSNSAIQRTVNYIEAAAAGYTTWKVAMNAAGAQQLVVNAATKAGEVVMGTYNLLMISLKGSTEGYTRAQQESAVASRTMWSTLSANPIGAVITLVGLVTTAYMAWKAATSEVTNKLGEQELKLKDEQSQLNTLAEAAMSDVNTRKQRKEAIELLIQKYPQYFAGLNAEKTTNAQLKEILDKVNDSYEKRIALARQTYNLEALAEKRKELFQFEKDFFDSLPKDIGDKFNNDISKFNEALKTGTATSAKLKEQLNDFAPGGAAFFGGVAQNAADRFKDVKDSFTKTTNTIKEIEAESLKASIDNENTRWKNQQANLDRGSKSYQAAEKEHLVALSKINGTYREKEIEDTATHEEKTKQITLRSANEKAALLKQQDAKTLEEKLKALDAREKAEQDSITKITVSKNASSAQIAALQKQADQKLLDLREEYNEKRARLIEEDRRNFEDALDVDLNGMQKLIDKTREEQNAYMTRAAKFGEFDKQRIQSFKEVAKEAEENEKKIQEVTKDTLEIRKKAAEDQKQAIAGQRQAAADLFISLGAMMGQQNEMAGLLSGVLNTTLSNMDLLSGKTQQVAKNAVVNAEAYYNMAKVRFADAGKEGELAIAKAGQNLEVAKAKSNEVSAASVTAAIGLAGMVLQVAQVIGATFDKIHTQVYQAIGTTLGNTLKAYNDFYDDLEKLQRENLDLSLEMYEGNFKEQKRLLDDFYDNQREQAKNRDFMNDMLASGKEYADAILAAGRDTVWNHKNYVEQMAQAEIAINRDKYLRQQQMAINQLEIDKEQLKETKDRKLQALDDELNAFRDAKNAEIDAANDAFDKQKDLIEQERDAKVQAIKDQIDAAKEAYDKDVQNARDAYDQQLDALREKQSAEKQALQELYDYKKSLLEQAASDEIEAIAIVDRLRNEAVDRYGVAEADKLVKTRDRILATLTDEGERASVIAFYDQKLKDLHDEVEQGKLDKSKGVSLATKQLNQELKDDTVRLKDEETTALKNLDDSYQIKFKALADERDSKLETLKNDYLTREGKLKEDIKTLETNSKNDIAKIQTELRDEINKLKDEITQKEAQTTTDKKRLNFEYKQAVLQANAEIFEAQRRMLIAQLQAQIAVLNSQKSWTGIGNGKINDAIASIEQSIRDIGGIVFSTAVDVSQLFDAYGLNSLGQQKKPLINRANPDGTLPEVNFPVYDADGNEIELSYKEGAGIQTVYNANKEPVQIIQATGKDKKTGKTLFFHGSDYVDGVGYPDGRDTVPAMVNKGERIVPTVLNTILGGKALSNEQLVDKVLAHDKLMKMFPDAAGLLSGSRGGSVMKLPDSIMKGNSTDMSGVRKDLHDVKRAIENYKPLQVSFDEHGITKALIGHQSKTILLQSLLNR